MAYEFGRYTPEFTTYDTTQTIFAGVHEVSQDMKGKNCESLKGMRTI